MTTQTLDALEAMAKDELRDRWTNYRDEFSGGCEGDVIHEVADSHVPVYTGELLELANDDNGLATDEPELGPAFDGTPTPVNIIAANVYERLTAVLWDAFREFEREETDQADERDRIEARGSLDGKAAASWVTDGNTRTETYAALLAGIEEGDPMILDTLPMPSLGGEWADSPTRSDVLREEDCEDSDDGRADLLDVYESAFSEAVMDEVTRACRYQLDAADLPR